jgi:hypothetical protein
MQFVMVGKGTVMSNKALSHDIIYGDAEAFLINQKLKWKNEYEINGAK